MYRGEIQNDSNGGNYNRSLDYTATSGGLGGGGRYETRNFAVGASLRGCGGDVYQDYMMSENDGTVLPDLTGEGFWEDVRRGLVKRNERKKTTPISEEDWKKQMEDYEKPTENWGMDELDGGAMVGGAPKPQPPITIKPIRRPNPTGPRPPPSHGITGVTGLLESPYNPPEYEVEGIPAPTAEVVSIVTQALNEANNFAERGVPAGPLSRPKQLKYQRDFRQAPCIRNTQLKDAVADTAKLLDDMSSAATTAERQTIITEEEFSIAQDIVDTVFRMPGNFYTNISVVMSRIQAETTATVGQVPRGSGFWDDDDDDDDDDELVGGAPKPRPPLIPLPKQLKPLPPAGSTSIPGAYLTDTTSDPRAPPPPPLPVSVLDYRRADDFSVPVVGQPAAAILQIRPSSQSDRLEIQDALIQANQAGLFAVGKLPKQASSKDKRSAYDAAFEHSLTTSSEIWKFLKSAPDGPDIYEQIYRNRDNADATIRRYMGDIGDGIKTVVSEMGGDFNDVIREIQRQTASDVTKLREARKRGSGVGRSVKNPIRNPLLPPDEASGMTEQQKQTVLEALKQADKAGKFNVDASMTEFLMGDHQEAYSDGFLDSLAYPSLLRQFFYTDKGKEILNYLKRNPVGTSAQEARTAYINRRLDDICTELVLAAKITNVKVEKLVEAIARDTRIAAAKLERDKQKASGPSGQGGAAPKVEAKPSPVAAVAAALKPAREAIQNGIGDALYGKETDPRKQKKGLLGISEEGKAESQKKVMKNIVVPLAKVGMEVKKGYTNAWNSLFNKDQFEADKKADELKEFRKLEKEAGVVRNKEGVIVKAPRYYDTNRPEGYVWTEQPNGSRTTSGIDTEFFKKQPSYIRIPNPIKAAGLRPSSRELELDDIKLWQSQDGKKGKVGDTLKNIQDDEFIFVPEADTKKIYSELRGFVEQEKGKELATGFEELDWTKGEMKDFGKMAADFKSFTPQEKRDYLQVKNLQEKQQLKNAAAKVDKDIADEEAKKVRTEIRGERPVQVGSEPDQARLAKMRDAKAKIVKLQESKAKEAQRQFKMDADAMDIEKQQSEEEYRKNLKNITAAPEVLPGEAPEVSPYEQEQSDDMAAFKALSPAERSIQLDAYRKELERSGFSEEQIQEAIGAVGGAKPVQMKQDDYYKEHQNIVKLLKNTGKSLLSEAKDQQEEASAMAKKMKAPDPFDDELMGEGGAFEYSLQTAARKLFNPTGNMTMAGKQTFTPDYDAYGDTIEDGRENAFALSRSMYNAQAIEIPGFDYYEGNASIRFYVKDDEDVVMVGIRGTNKRNWRELLATWASMVPESGDLSFTSRFQEDLRSLQEFQKEFPISQFYYVATGHSLGGAIADRFLDMGLISEALTYNPAIEKKYILDGDIHNHRVYLDTDPLFILMGQFAPNTEIRVNASKADFYNPIKEGEYLVNSHQITPNFNPAFEGGGMMGAGKTYTLEEWKRIFDAKLEKKRQQIEARAAKKKDTAKAKRARAKERRDERAEIPELETPFRTSRVMKATPPPAPKKPRKPRLKIVAAPASARVELREELVAEQPRNPEGVFEAENVIVSRPQKSLGVPTFTEGEKRMIQNLQRSEMTQAQKAKLLARSGIAAKLMEMLAVAPSDSSQGARELKAIVGKQQKRVEGEKVRAFYLPEDIEAIFRKQEEGLIGRAERMKIPKNWRRGDGGADLDTLIKSCDTFGKCGFGCLNLVAECMADDPFDTYLAAGRVKEMEAVGEEGGRYLTLMMNMTKADEDYDSSVGFWSYETRPDTTMNFGLNKHPSDFLVEFTEKCLGRLNDIDGISSVEVDTRNAGMGNKRRNVFRVYYKGVAEVKRFTEAVKSEYTAKIRSEVVPKIRELVAVLKPEMLKRVKVMKDRVEHGFSSEQRWAMEAYQHNRDNR